MDDVHQGDQSLRALRMELQANDLLLPYSLVQEIIAWHPPTALDSAPDWLLGSLDWRGRPLPVVSPDRLVGTASGQLGRRAHVTVCSLMNPQSALPCVGLVSDQVPRLVRLQTHQLGITTDQVNHNYWAQETFTYEGSSVWLPNFTKLTEALMPFAPEMS
jgi:chemosensory pili system protein ChpC